MPICRMRTDVLSGHTPLMQGVLATPVQGGQVVTCIHKHILVAP